MKNIMARLSHLNKDLQPAIVDVSEKPITRRSATARCIVVFPEVVKVKLQKEDFSTSKGSVFQVATLAGVMAAKKTADLIPLCHPLGLDNCQLDIKLNGDGEVEIYCTAQIEAKTGVEMEALTGATIAALTIYDMCKALSHDILIKEVQLMEKSGGKNDFKRK